MKSSNSIGCGKELVVTTSNWSVNGVPYFSFGYTYSDERFERPIKTAYKVSIHDKSYRDDKGKVQKKQYYLVTIKYYDFIEFGWYTCISEGKVDEIAEKIGIDTDILWAEIEDKLDILEDKIKQEFEQTEEYRVNEKHSAILKEHHFTTF